MSPRISQDGIVVTTTDSVPGYEVESLLGVVTGEWVGGVNIARDFMAGIRNVVGGRSGSLEKELRAGRDAVLADLRERAAELGASAVIGVRFDSSSMGGMLMLGAVGTAVTVRRR